ncbi:LCP family protein [Euzebya tangerina]|uniref:LCP family protein n=1 Tax=Euzebya tangerina TaxID=591198 RepID=UPI000E3149A6|nr:LCP family protein [Euzebya tangerina]
MSGDYESIDRTYGERWGGDQGPHHDDFGPAMRGRHRRLTFGGALGAALNLALFGILLLALVFGGLAVYSSSQINREPIEGLARGEGALNVLIVGSDSRDGFTPEELAELGTEAVEGRRTDTIFLLSVDGGRAAMLSFPRDLFVTACDGQQGRINAAYARLGPSCLVQTVTSLTGINIDHYVEVNLFGFVQIVDAVGGVPIFLDAPLVDPFAGINLPAGCNVLDGRQAIGFVRSRMIDSDLGRIARQQRFLRELAEEVISPSTVVNVPRLFRVARSSGQSLISDQGLGLLDLARLARAARGLAGAGLATYTVPADAANVDGAAVLIPDAPLAEPLFAQFADGSILQIPPTPEVAAAQPGDVPIRVLNGAGVDGLAAQARQFMMDRGFEITGIGNADPVPATVVQYGPGRAAAAQLVADQIPGATIAETEGISDIVLIVGPGADFSAPPPPPMEDDPRAAEEVPLGAAPVPEDCA